MMKTIEKIANGKDHSRQKKRGWPKKEKIMSLKGEVQSK